MPLSASELDKELDNLSYLWDGSEQGWTLIHINPSAPAIEARFIIQNEHTKIAVIVENDSQYKKVVTRMKDAGVKVKTT